MTLLDFAQSGDVEFLDRMGQPTFHGFVHSVFNRTFNIRMLDSDELYTIASRELDNGPNTLIIDAEGFQDVGLLENDRVFVEDGLLHIGNKLVIFSKNCEKWCSVLPEYPEDLTVVTRNLLIMKRYVDVYGKGGGVKPDFTTDNLFSKEVSRVLNEQSRLLIEELSAGRIDNALQHAKALIGLGPGLTPSGDDFLVGLFTILNVQGIPFNGCLSFCEKVVELSKTLTNEISYMALKKASIGKVRESIIQLLSSVFYENEEKLLLSLNKVLSIGSSSGTDIALGLISGLEANIIKAGGKL